MTLGREENLLGMVLAAGPVLSGGPEAKLELRPVIYYLEISHMQCLTMASILILFNNFCPMCKVAKPSLSWDIYKPHIAFHHYKFY